MVQICNETPNLSCFASKSSKTRKKHMSLAENVKKQPKIDAERHLMVQICNETPNLFCFASKSSNIVHKITETAKKTQDMG